MIYNTYKRCVLLALVLIIAIIIRDSQATEAPYPVEASWFEDRYTQDDWLATIQSFESIGGHIIWKRGRIFRTISADDLQSHPDFQWCQVDNINCVQLASDDASTHGFVLNKFLIYDYEENYNTSILTCSTDRIIYGSRIYHMLYLPHTNYQESNPCDLKWKLVDVLFISYAGIDSSEILFDVVKSKTNFQIYLGAPYLPVQVKAPWAVDKDLLPPFFEFTRRVYKSYSDRFAKYGNIFAGIYQAFEVYFGSTIDENALYAYKILQNMTHTLMTNKSFVLSPYPLANKDFATSTVQGHVDNFKILAPLSDIIAIQEGRGCGNQAYFEIFQNDTAIKDIDPVLDEIVKYRHSSQPVAPTFGETFSFRTQDLFAALSQAIIELGSSAPKLWLNIEAFEYLRNDPCYPVDTVGNGMAEILDRSNKSRIDWAIQSQSAYVSGIISFAWDSDYVCTTKTQSNSIYQEILSDYQRPIISQVGFYEATGAQVFIRGFNLAYSASEFQVTWTDFSGSKRTKTYKQIAVDPDWGKKNNRSYLMGQAIIQTNWILSDLCLSCPIEFYASYGSLQSTHLFYGYANSMINESKEFKTKIEIQ